MSDTVKVVVAQDSAIARLMKSKQKGKQPQSDVDGAKPTPTVDETALATSQSKSTKDASKPDDVPSNAGNDSEKQSSVNVVVKPKSALAKLLAKNGDGKGSKPTPTQDSASNSAPGQGDGANGTASTSNGKGGDEAATTPASGSETPPKKARKPRESKPRAPRASKKSKADADKANDNTTADVNESKPSTDAGDKAGSDNDEDAFKNKDSASTPKAKRSKSAGAAKPTKPRTPKGTKGKPLRELVSNLYKTLFTMVTVRHWNGSAHSIAMSKRSEPLEDFMKKIATATGVPVDKQHLLFRGKVLKLVDDEGNPTTLFTYNIAMGDTIQMIRDSSDPKESDVTIETKTETPVATQSSQAVTTQSQTQSRPQPSGSGTGTGQSNPTRANEVLTRVTVGLGEDGVITCEQPTGTVHNTDSGVPTDNGVVCRWGRVWVLASAPVPLETVTPINPASSPGASSRGRPKKPRGDDDDAEYKDDGSGDESDDASDVSLVEESQSEGDDDGEEEEDMSIPTTAEECVARMGLKAKPASSGSSQYDVVVLTELNSTNGVVGTVMETGDSVTLTAVEAIDAVKRYVEAKQLVASKRGSKKKKSSSSGGAGGSSSNAKGSSKDNKTAKSKTGKKPGAGSVEFHFIHHFAPKSRMPDAKYYRLLWRPLPESDPEAIEDASVREVAMEEDAQRPFAVVVNATGKIRHMSSNVVVKIPRGAVAAGEYTLGLTVRRDECSCGHCLGDDDIDSCEHCGCVACLRKADPEKMIICDECGKGYHHYCLSSVEGSHITIDSEGKDIQRTGNLTDAEFAELVSLDNEVGMKWCCPACNVRNQLKEAQEKSKAKKKRLGDEKQGWGGGLATAGYTKVSSLPANHIGKIPGVPVGSTFMSRNKAAESGVHRAPMAGIHGRANEGAFAICHSSGYDNADSGEVLWYTGQGGRNLEGNKRTNTVHSKDQEMKLGNAALITSFNAEDYTAGKPVRVLRGHKLDGRSAPEFAPIVPMGYDKAYRYDGLYKVAEFKEEKDENGFGVYKFKMIRDDPEPPVWSEEGKLKYARIIVGIEKQVRNELIQAGFGPQLQKVEAECSEALAGESLPGCFSGLPLDADLDAEEEKVLEKLEEDVSIVIPVYTASADGEEAATKPKTPRKKKAAVTTLPKAEPKEDDDVEMKVGTSDGGVGESKAIEPMSNVGDDGGDGVTQAFAEAEVCEEEVKPQPKKRARKPAATKPTASANKRGKKAKAASSSEEDELSVDSESSLEPVAKQTTPSRLRQRRAVVAYQDLPSSEDEAGKEKDEPAPIELGQSHSDDLPTAVDEPPVKKKSADAVVVDIGDDSEDGDDVKPQPKQRGRKPGVKAASSKRGKKPVASSEDELSVASGSSEDEPAPKKTSLRQRRAVQYVESESEYDGTESDEESDDDDDDEDDSSDEDVRPKRSPKRQPATAAKRKPLNRNSKAKASKPIDDAGSVDSEDHDNESDDDVKPQPKKRGRAGKKATGGGKRVSKRKDSSDEEDEASMDSESSDEPVAKKPTSTRLRQKRSVTYVDHFSSESEPEDRVLESDGDASVDVKPKPTVESTAKSTPDASPKKAPAPGKKLPTKPSKPVETTKPKPVSSGSSGVVTNAAGEDVELVKLIEADELNAARWTALREQSKIAVPPMTIAKLDAISFAFRCAVTQELVQAPAVTPVCCKQNINASSLKTCVSKMDMKKACPLCRTPTSNGKDVSVGSAQFPVNKAMTDALTKLFTV